MLNFSAEKTGYEEKNILFLALSPIFFLNVFGSFQLFNFVFLIPAILFIYWADISPKYFLGALSIIFLISLSSSLFPHKIKNTYLIFLNKFLNIHNFITTWVEKNYEQELAKFINLLLFNKSKYDSSVYRQISELGIAHLITISGFHFSLLKKAFDIGFRNFKFLKNFISIPLFLLFWAANNYSIPITRIILGIFIAEKNKFKKWSYISLSSIFFNLGILTTFSFLLSFMLPLFFLIVNKYSDDRCYRLIFKNLFAFIYVNGLFLPSTKKIVFLQPFNIIIFSPIVFFLFFYFFFCFLITYLSVIHTFFYLALKWVLKFFEFNKKFIEFPFWNLTWSKILIFGVLSTLLHLYLSSEVKSKIIPFRVISLEKK